MTTDPGSVPKNARPLIDDEEERMYDPSTSKTGNFALYSLLSIQSITILKPGESFKKYCKRCKAFKPSRAHHCSICNRCIIKMDHHCKHFLFNHSNRQLIKNLSNFFYYLGPWVNNCVGIGNHKLFLLFIFFVFLVSIYSILLLVLQYVLCSVYGHGCGDDVINIFVVFLFIESACCGVFTSWSNLT